MNRPLRNNGRRIARCAPFPPFPPCFCTRQPLFRWPSHRSGSLPHPEGTQDRATTQEKSATPRQKNKTNLAGFFPHLHRERWTCEGPGLPNNHPLIIRQVAAAAPGQKKEGQGERGQSLSRIRGGRGRRKGSVRLFQNEPKFTQGPEKARCWTGRGQRGGNARTGHPVGWP